MTTYPQKNFTWWAWVMMTRFWTIMSTTFRTRKFTTSITRFTIGTRFLKFYKNTTFINIEKDVFTKSCSLDKKILTGNISTQFWNIRSIFYRIDQLTKTNLLRNSIKHFVAGQWTLVVTTGQCTPTYTSTWIFFGTITRDIRRLMST